MSLIPLSMSGIAAPLRSESVNQSGSSQADSGGVGVGGGGGMCSYQFCSIELNSKRIAENEAGINHF